MIKQIETVSRRGALMVTVAGKGAPLIVALILCDRLACIWASALPRIADRRRDPQVAMRTLMCRNIKTLHNFKPPATEEEIRASSLQFVRKLSGFTRPSKTNELAFNRAVDQVVDVVHELLEALVTNASPRDRDVEAEKARARTQDRFAGSGSKRTN
jgi:hypothetical protein